MTFVLIFAFPFFARCAYGPEYYCIADKAATPQTFGLCKNYQVYAWDDFQNNILNADKTGTTTIKVMIMLKDYTRDYFKCVIKQDYIWRKVSISCYQPYNGVDFHVELVDLYILGGNMKGNPLSVSIKFSAIQSATSVIIGEGISMQSELKTIQVTIYYDENVDSFYLLLMVDSPDIPLPTVFAGKEIIEPERESNLFYYDLVTTAKIKLTDGNWDSLASKVQMTNKKYVKLFFDTETFVSSGQLKLNEATRGVIINGSIHGSIDFVTPDVPITFQNIDLSGSELSVKVHCKCSYKSTGDYPVSLLNFEMSTNINLIDYSMESGCEKQTSNIYMYLSAVPKDYEVKASRSNIFIYLSNTHYQYTYVQNEESSESQKLYFCEIFVHYDYSLWAGLGIAVVVIIIIVSIVICCVKSHKKNKRKREKSNSDNLNGKSNSAIEV